MSDVFIGWESIWRNCFHGEDRLGNTVPLMALRTLQTKHSESLQECGAVVKIHFGRQRRRKCVGYKDRIYAWQVAAAQKGLI